MGALLMKMKFMVIIINCNRRSKNNNINEY